MDDYDFSDPWDGIYWHEYISGKIELEEYMAIMAVTGGETGFDAAFDSDEEELTDEFDEDDEFYGQEFDEDDEFYGQEFDEDELDEETVLEFEIRSLIKRIEQEIAKKKTAENKKVALTLACNKKSGRFETWPIPYLSKLEMNKMPLGDAIIIRGFLYGSKGLSINLSVGDHVEEDGDDISLHLHFSPVQKKVVMKSLRDKVWVQEEKLKNPIHKGENFYICIVVQENKYEVLVNYKKLGTYHPSIQFNKVSHILVSGDIQLFSVQCPTNYFTLPYETAISGYFPIGRKLYVSGQVRGTGKGFQIKLYSRGFLALLFQPTFSSNRWFDVQELSSFDIIIVSAQNWFKCYIDGEVHCTLMHTISPNHIGKLVIEGDVQLNGVHFNQPIQSTVV